QKRDSRAVDARADVYGLGATLWFLLAGRPPGELPFHETGERPGGLPAWLWRKLLAADPADRFPGAGEAAEALARFAGSGQRRGRGVWLAPAVVAAALLI